MLQNEYYVIQRENNDNYPMFSWDEESTQFGCGRPVERDEPVRMRLGDPISPNFEWVDYHIVPDPVVSARIAKALLPLDLHGVQFIPAKVRDARNPASDEQDYYFLHVWNRIHCLDKEHSELDMDEVDGRIWSIDKFVLDEKTLEKYELRKRMVFELAEKTSVLLVHQKVKEAIESVKPKGCRFFKATEWNSDKTFE